ncbi:hypothetical protein DW322_08690 [Rhodococcus rhodnii]|uniref:Uncharacterized protein n=2 Tax=Rhodococcus rhodnii TaxID=38312 RepID=R7WQR7_9NOCA|nr:hypothetical protein [Rhodococcus rhodnii]EOM77663.1 hypothetical protein Rrhod_0982 [Rhodococcus rhodnii LMG 5362]TXG90286.1 hypothetical protein DW322_08690 [Rhodococcus rhodnii]
MSIEQIVKELAAITAAEKLVAAAKTAKKDELQAQLTRGTAYAYAAVGGEQVELGYATVPKPSVPKPRVEIVDEARVLPWAVDAFGDSVLTTRLSEQGRKSVIEAALIAHETGDELDGVAVSVPAATVPTPRFTPAKNVVELVQGMVARGEISLGDVLALPQAGEPA